MSDGGTVAKNTIYLTVGSIAQKLLSFVYFTIIARLLGTGDTGKYLYALSYLTAFSVIVDLGLQPVLIRSIARAKDKVGETVRNVLGIKVVLFVIAVTALIVSALHSETDPVRQQLIWYGAIVIVLDSIHFTCYGVLRGFEKLRYEALGMIVSQVLTIAVGTAIILLHLPLPLLMFSFVVSSLVNVIYASTMVRRVTGVRIRPEFNRAIWKGMLRMAIPFAASAIFSKIYSSADSLILGHLRSNTEVAWYGVPYKMTFAFQFIPLALSAALFPTLARALVEDKTRVAALWAACQRYLMLVAVPIVAGLFVLARPFILLFYGSSYLPSVAIMQILAFSLFTAFLDIPVGSLLNAAHRQNIQTTWLGITMATNIVLNLFLIPRFGTEGAAFAALAGNAILFFGGLAFMPNIIRVDWRTLLTSLVRITLSALAMAFVISFTDDRLPLIVSFGIGVLVYVGALFICREIGRRDVEQLRDLIHPKQPSVDQLV
jgi:O-antigen/teichoic acid export membrane protein